MAIRAIVGGSDSKAAAFKALAQGCGFVKDGSVTLEETEGECCVTRQEDGAVLSDVSEILSCICGDKEKELFPEGLTSEWLRLAVSSNYELIEESVIDNLEAHLAANNGSLSEKQTGVDFIVFGSLKKWMLTSSGAAKAQHRRVLGLYNGIAKSENFKKAPAPKPQAPVDTRPLDDVTRFDIVVGKVTKAWPHPEADA